MALSAGVATSASSGPLTAGSYSYQATYSGDGTYTGSTGACEPLTVTLNPSNTVTSIMQAGSTVTSVALGSSVSDQATVTGSAGTPTGTVTFTFFTSGDCSTGGTAGSPVALSSGVANSASSGPLTAGSYSYQATYNGEAGVYAGSTGSCEPLTVTKAPTTTVTNIKQSGSTVTSVALGSSVTDLATVSGQVGAIVPTGTVSFSFFATSNCTGTATSAGSPALSGGTATSNSEGPLAVGSYSFQATYSGDANYTGSTGACEPLAVTKAPTTTVTNIKQGGSTVTSIASGGSVTDVATVSGQVGAIAPTGTVAFSFFATANCTGTATSAGSPALSAGSATSSSEGPLAAGSYSFQATYSGDANYVGSTGGCEPLTVTSPPPSGGGGTPAIGITKNPKSQSIATGATANFTIVVTNTGSLTLTNVSVSDPLSPNCNQTSSSIPALASMAPGASVTYNCSLSNVTASFTNVATATGTGSNGQTVTASDSAPVTVTAPQTPPPVTPAPTPHAAIGIVKDPKSQTIGQGGTAKFTITVTNTGDVTLSNVQVTDPLSPGCDKSLGTLAVGQSKSYSCSKDNVTADFENVATATGKPPTTATVKATDHAQINVQAFVPPQHPKIAIVKSPKSQTLTTKLHTVNSAGGASKTTVTYGTAHFTIKVTNTGDVTLHDVKVTDPASPGCDKNLGALASNASKTYSCTRSTVRSDFTNVATARGTSPKGKQVEATDHADVKVTTKTTATNPAKFTG